MRSPRTHATSACAARATRGFRRRSRPLSEDWAWSCSRSKAAREAAVVLAAPADQLAALEAFGADALAELFIVSGVDFAEGEGLSAAIRPADGEKCPRCWNFRALGGNPNHPDVCERCGDALDAIGFSEEG